MHDPADVLRFTVGRIEVVPNSPNSVPAEVIFSIDFRHPEAAVLDARGGQIERRLPPLCRRLRGAGQRDLQPAAVRVPDADRGRGRERPRAALGIGHMRLPSGAFHDANFIADVCPTGMIFVPCEQGHQPQPGRERQARGPRRRRPRARRDPGRRSPGCRRVAEGDFAELCIQRSPLRPSGGLPR